MFELSGHRYGLRSADVLEVVRAVTIVPLAGAPAIVEGVINVRSRLVPVLDVRARFGHPARAVEPSDHIVIAQAGERRVALRADGALALVRIDEADIDEARRVVPNARFVAGLARLAEGLVVVHDLLSFLLESEGEEIDRALREAGR